jgi:glycosyltransferase involved in cell wall biosynthesis
MDPGLKISIVIPTYNGVRYIRQSIESCLGQTHRNIQLIVVDDGSTDETPDIVNSYDDHRLKYVSHEENKGLPLALNTGFANADGDYLSWTSDDNYYTPDAMEKMLSFLKTKKCHFVYADFYRFVDKNPHDRRIVKLPDISELDRENCIGPCFLYGRQVGDATGEYDPDTFLSEDYDYWIRVSKRFLICHLAEPLYHYRVHDRSLSTSRYMQAHIIGILVRMKNDVLDADCAKALLLNLVSRRYVKRFGINKILANIVFSRKIGRVARDFESKELSLKEARLALESIMVRD